MATKEATRPQIGDKMENNGVMTTLVDIQYAGEGNRAETWTSDGGKLDLQWCMCGAESGFYWEVLTVGIDERIKGRSHGWGCPKCRKVTQTG